MNADPAPRAAPEPSHDANMARLRRTLMGYTILKIGLLSLIAVILYKVFGEG